MLNTTGPISIGGSVAGESINLEFGFAATRTTDMASLYRGAGIVSGGAPNVPTSGLISLAGFRGASNVLPPLTSATYIGHATSTAGGSQMTMNLNFGTSPASRRIFIFSTARAAVAALAVPSTIIMSSASVGGSTITKVQTSNDMLSGAEVNFESGAFYFDVPANVTPSSVVSISFDPIDYVEACAIAAFAVPTYAVLAFSSTVELHTAYGPVDWVPALWQPANETPNGVGLGMIAGTIQDASFNVVSVTNPASLHIRDIFNVPGPLPMRVVVYDYEVKDVDTAHNMSWTWGGANSAGAIISLEVKAPA